MLRYTPRSVFAPVRLPFWLVCACLVVAVSATRADEAKVDKRPLWMVSVAKSGVGTYRSGEWGLVRGTVDNATDEDATVELAVSFKDQPHIQFTVPVWVPANSTRAVWFPVRLPTIPLDKRQIDLNVLLLGKVDGREQELKSAEAALTMTGLPPITILLNSMDWAPDSGNLMTAVRRIIGEQYIATPYVNEEALPASVAGWNAVDSFMIAREHPNLDAAQMAALRQWLIRGGTLWLLAERVDPAFMAQLLGDDWNISIVDRVELNEFTITGGAQPLDRRVELPIDMVRVVQTGWEVVHQINGWPASLRKRCGMGHVVLTTVGPRAWYGWVMAQHHVSKEMVMQPDAIDQLRELSKDFNRLREPAPSSATLVAPLATEQIGYRILSPKPVVWILGGLCAAILIVAIILQRLGRLEHMAWVATLLAVGAALFLFGIGNAHKSAKPLTVAEARFVQVVPGQSAALTGSALAIYSPDDIPDVELKGTLGGQAWPDLSAQSQGLVRLTWDDLDQWRWHKKLRAPEGSVLRATLDQIEHLSAAPVLELSFDEQGLTGKLQAEEFQPLEDALLVTPGRLYAVKMNANTGTIRVTSESELPTGQYLRGATLSSTQQRRKGVLDSVLAPKKKSDLQPEHPVLLAWSKATTLKSSVSIAQEPQEKPSETLLSLETSLLPAKPGDRVRIPAGFISMSPKDPTGQRRAQAYDFIANEWIPTPLPIEVALHFALPKEVVPLKVTGGKLRLNMQAPGRAILVYAIQNGQRVTLLEQNGMTGPTSIDLAPYLDAVQPDANGVIPIGVKVGPHTDPQNLWQMIDTALEIDGQVKPH